MINKQQYVKFGSRRGEHGDIFLLDIFYNHNIVFAEIKSGAKKVQEKAFKKGTKIIIADGLTVVALAISETDSNSIDTFTDINFSEEERSRMNISNSVIAAKVKIHTLKEEDRFKTIIGKFFHIKKEEIKNKIDSLLSKYNQ